MPPQQGSAGGRGSDGGSKGGPQSGSTGRSSSTTGPSVGGPSIGEGSARQNVAKSPGISGPSPTYTEGLSGEQSAHTGASFGTDGPDAPIETTDSHAASRKGCGCCGGAATAIIVATIVSLICFSF